MSVASSTPSASSSTPSEPGGASLVTANLAVVAGLLAADPVLRELPSGDLVADLSVRTTNTDGRVVTAPVAWHRPGSGVHRLHQDSQVLVVGRVARRFFRSGGRVVSRTEIIATSVVRPTQKVTWNRAQAQAEAALAELIL